MKLLNALSILLIFSITTFAADSDDANIKEVVAAVKRAASLALGDDYADQPLTPIKTSVNVCYYFRFTPMAGRKIEFQYFPEFEFYRWREMSELMNGSWNYVDYGEEGDRR